MDPYVAVSYLDDSLRMAQGGGSRRGGTAATQATASTEPPVSPRAGGGSMRFLDCFSGIGGFSLGLEWAGMVCVGQIEVDPYCRNVLERHWPGVWRRGDIRLVDVSDCPKEIDLVCGGFPCQDISAAGKGAGITGWRSGLWTELLRLVSGLRPRWVLVENVPALRTRGADVVLGGLEAEGYACWPHVVGAWAVGAPHRRDRVWIVGHAAGARRGGNGSGNGTSRREQESVSEPRGAPVAQSQSERRATEGRGRARCDEGTGAPDGGMDDDDDGRGTRRGGGRGRDGTPAATTPAQGRTMGDPDEPRLAGRGVSGRERPHQWPAGPSSRQDDWEPARTTQPRVGRRLDGVSRKLALKALGNAVVPAVVEVIGRVILDLDAGPARGARWSGAPAAWGGGGETDEATEHRAEGP